MKILHLNSSDLGGGAGRVAYRLAQRQRQLNQDARFLVGKKISNADWVRQITPGQQAFVVDKVVGAFVDALGIQYLFYPYSLKLLNHDWVRQADVINLHNTHSGYLSWWLLPYLSRNATLVWTLHDMWTMTGHCASPESVGCDRWQNGCGQCPDLKIPPATSWDTTRLQWKLKRRLYGQLKNPVFVCPSRWLQEQAQRSPLVQKYSVYHIPNGINTEVFRVQDKQVARSILGLNSDHPVLMALASESIYKGGDFLVDIMRRISVHYDKDMVLLLVGSGYSSSLSQLPSVRLHNLGPIQSEYMMAVCYAAADLFLFPSLAENFPTMLLESLACGTPAVAFDTGGVKEIVRDQQTGYLAPLQDCAAFADNVLKLLDDNGRLLQMAANGSALINDEYTLEKQARRYTDLYQEIGSTT